jgi:hypothetical protein
LKFEYCDREERKHHPRTFEIDANSAVWHWRQFEISKFKTSVKEFETG